MRDPVVLRMEAVMPMMVMLLQALAKEIPVSLAVNSVSV